MSERHSAPTGQRSGIIVSTPYEGGVVVQSDTISCCHCGCVYQWKPGSGKRRGFCLRCNGFTCGTPRCDACIPVEQLLENIEAGRSLDFRRIIAATSDGKIDCAYPPPEKPADSLPTEG